MASRLQDVILRGTSGAKPVATLVAPGTIYFSTDLGILERSTGLIWESYSGAGTPSSSTIVRLGQPFVWESEEYVYEPPIPGPPGLRGLTGPTGPAGGGGSGGGSGSSIPFFPDVEDMYEPAIPVPGPPGVPGASGSITAAQKTRQIGVVVDGGASVLTTGFKGYKSFPVAGTIIAVRMLADVSGSIVMDIWKDSYANYPPTVVDTITAAAKPTITTAIKSEDVTLTGWTIAVAAGDVFAFNIDSVSVIKRILLELTIVVT